MKAIHRLIISLPVVALTAWAAPGFADTTQARCEVFRDSPTKSKTESGTCTFSQRQGNVHIVLRNGADFNLNPSGKSNNFKDGQGRNVQRTVSDDKHAYRWPAQNLLINVFFDDRGDRDAGGETTCDVFRDSKTKSRNESGACTVSQRQGNVHIVLRNGSEFNLSLGGKANSYRDGRGRNVQRTVTGDKQSYRWTKENLLIDVYQGGGRQRNGSN